MYYREKLFGKDLQSLLAEKNKENKHPPDANRVLPSEQWYNKNRLDEEN